MVRNCKSCLFELESMKQQPCCNCKGFSEDFKWKPKQPVETIKERMAKLLVTACENYPIGTRVQRIAQEKIVITTSIPRISLEYIIADVDDGYAILYKQPFWAEIILEDLAEV